ncbi:unnamed protein product [Spirodela intermedia]|uniref:NAC domain-containing protein n=1 Tax=Spirodela intermedia TaxID=51605 RepID=A0A7I8ITC1_SPIIN|nr:unnamed protein product [Spirodela intermedia]CAA6660385.1 unnamed protein product [Spirodela intermedia]
MGNGAGDLPPGFRFFPSDEELVVHFLHRKAAHLPCYPDVIPSLDPRHYDPWDLNGNQWYFFTRRALSRVWASGYWMPTGVEKPVTSAGRNVGIKKYLAFYAGQAPDFNEWVLGRVYESDFGSQSSFYDDGTELSCLDEMFLSLDDLDEISLPK